MLRDCSQPSFCVRGRLRAPRAAARVAGLSDTRIKGGDAAFHTHAPRTSHVVLSAPTAAPESAAPRGDACPRPFWVSRVAVATAALVLLLTASPPSFAAASEFELRSTLREATAKADTVEKESLAYAAAQKQRVMMAQMESMERRMRCDVRQKMCWGLAAVERNAKDTSAAFEKRYARYGAEIARLRGEADAAEAALRTLSSK